MNKREIDQKQHIIYYEWFLDIRAGGPTGYLANLLDGMNQCDNNNNPIILFDVDTKQPVQNEEKPSGIHGAIQRFFYEDTKRKRFYINNISRYQKSIHKNYMDFLKCYDLMFCKETLFSKINLENTKTIHVHNPGDAVKVKNTLLKLGRDDIKLMLTCHTPEAPSNEYYNSTLDQGFNNKRAEEIREAWKVVEAKAFEYADILVFPSEESMEPLKQTMDNFEKIINSKDIRFIATGAKKLRPTLSREEAKKKYGVEGKFVVGYIGRHNAIKGYDILQQAAVNILDKQDDICFLIGGAQGNAFNPLKHDRWIEAGWINPADMFMAIDIFVLPNRMTYYDLVLLEVMSLGIPIIASNTGGNKSVQKMTDSLCLYDNTAEDLTDKLLKYCHMSSKELQDIGNKTLASYEKYFTTCSFAERYKSMINEIYSDYKFL